MTSAGKSIGKKKEIRKRMWPLYLTKSKELKERLLASDKIIINKNI
jgi:hypothetical protein|tara:strand:- start:1028 stop:1165 length:138 start_codon:yes stop_codon:yes gene_type:complete